MWKNNWPEVRDRYCAFWAGEKLDRPPVLFDGIGLLRHPMYRGAGYDYTRYGEDISRFCADFSAVWQARAAVPDDTVPCIAPQMGGALEPALLAGAIDWGTELSTLVPHTPLAACTDIGAVSFRRDNPYFLRVSRELAYLEGVSGGDFGINVEAAMSVTSTISQLRGGTRFMYDLVDRPEAVRRLSEAVLEALLAVRAETARRNPLPEGTAHRWLNYWHPGTGFWFSEDDAVMLSPGMYRDLFLDLDIRLCAGVDVATAHWHTAGLHLLPVIAEIPNLRMVQISFDPNGPDLDTVLRACRPVAEAGIKLCFQMGYSPEFVRQVFRVVPPAACLFYFAHARDAGDAERILAEVTAAAGRYTRRSPGRET